MMMDELQHQTTTAAAAAATTTTTTTTTTTAESPIKRIRKYDQQWLQHFENLKTFRAKYGHCKVPADHGRLGYWVQNQRRFNKRGVVPDDRKALLDEIGFLWIGTRDGRRFRRRHRRCGDGGQTNNKDKKRSIEEEEEDGDTSGETIPAAAAAAPPMKRRKQKEEGAWLEKFEQLKKFRDAHGHWNIPNGCGEGSLNRWVTLQRTLFKEGRMREDQKDLLEEIGFLSIKSWEEYYDDLKAYKLEHGHVNVCQQKDGGNDLLHWVRKQRYKFQRGAMLEYHKKLLEDIGFSFWNNNDTDDVWQKKFQEFVAYKTAHGQMKPARSYSELYHLAMWIQKQRAMLREGTIRTDRKKVLNDIGFFAGGGDECENYKVWMKKYKELEEFSVSRGHVIVPAEDLLSTWTAEQRLDHIGGRIDKRKKEMLDSLDFFCQNGTSTRKHKDSEESSPVDHVNMNAPDDGPFSTWTEKQRLDHETGQPDTKKRAMLDSGDFNCEDETWMKKYRDLKEFRRLHGHVNVPSEDPLSNWTEEQRFNHVEGRMDATKKAILDSVGFVWEDKIWLKSYKDLEEFWLLHGHVNVPVEDDLSAWTEKQRLDHAAGLMDSKKKMLLNWLEFAWEDPDFQGYASTVIISI